MSEPGRNVPASVRRRLTDLAKTRGIEFQRILVLYTLERLLYRLSVSEFADQFILKGASLFSIWFPEPHRRTRDVDLLGKGDPNPERFARLFADICRLNVDADGICFASESVKAKPIREDNEFGGVRVTMTAFLENARIQLQVNIGFGDATVPEPQEVDFPILLQGYPAPRLRAYQKETTIAEKLQALVALDRGNSRMKDFFDLYVLSEEFDFSKERWAEAVRDVFARRITVIPADVPDGLTSDFAEDHAKIVQWKAFLNQNVSPPRNTLTLSEVIAALQTFLLPVLAASATVDTSEAATWTPGGPWKTADLA